MTGNEGRTSSSFSESVSLEMLSSDRSTGLTASDQEEHHDGDNDSADVDKTPPPLGVKLTGYRLLNMTTVSSFGITKGILTYLGQSTAPTTLDWVSGTLLAVVLYWVGLYEDRDSKKGQWFFQVDLAPAICNFAKRFVGEVLWLLFCLDGLVLISSLSNFLGNLVVLLLVRSVPHFPLGAQWGAYLGFVFCVHILWYSVVALTRRVRARSGGWQRVLRFVGDHGPVPLPERHGRFRAVGTIARLFCGVILVGLSLVIYLHLVWAPLCLRHVGPTIPCKSEGTLIRWLAVVLVQRDSRD